MRDNKVKRYGHDRRRQKKQRVFSTVLTAVLILAAAAAGWFVYPAAYDYFTRPRDVVSDPAESVQPSSESSEALPASSAAEPADESQEELLYAFVPHAQLTAGSDLAAHFAAIKSSGFNGVLLELKDETGIIRYNSSAAAAYAPQAVAADAYDLAAVLSAAKDAGLTVGGHLYAFRDPVAARILYSAAVKYNHTEINWIDNSQAEGGKPWLNPNNSAAQNYIVALAREAAAAGVSYIVLDGVQFPTGYSLNLATYSAAGIQIDKSSILSGFLRKARNALAEYGSELLCSIDLTGLLGADGGIRFGDDPKAVAACGDRILLDLSPEQFGSAFVHGDLTLASPALDPYNTVYATLALAGLDAEKPYVGTVQAYTSQRLPETGNKPYTKTEIQEQMRAAEEYGITSFALYNPTGLYDNWS